jgi:mRNA interferase YafQ
MLHPIFTKRFKKQLKLMEKRRLDISKVRGIMNMLANEQPLPPRYENHPLHGEWEGCLECHIEPDWLLIYEIDQSVKEITFHRTGTHSDLY